MEMPGRTRGETRALRDASRDYAHGPMVKRGGIGAGEFDVRVGGGGSFTAGAARIWNAHYRS